MRHNILLDTSVTGSLFHTLRAFLWNVKTLGVWWWVRCFVENVTRSALEFARRAKPIPIMTKTSWLQSN
ncbi:MAG: hypothetical protein K8F92_17890 [Hyphomicrobium sp.]|uniref:hypothetical protein n=1 Tax=Hyphomicrobium sp. TaxID=82 RepID=UPI0025BA0B44|nr:hypothetical protein [Hyphomicrobium sp.]MBZ0211500.1 hypothetical protein [Hyphomicrobium sp.]